MNDINKLKLPDDWAEGYESPITLAFQELANKIKEERDDRIIAEISEQIGVNVDKHELARALAYDRDQYGKGFEAAWLAREKDMRRWIPIKTRPLTDEELKSLSQYYGSNYKDTAEEWAFDCPMPEDGQEILISTSWGVSTDYCKFDCTDEGFGLYSLEDLGDWDHVKAWMPMPKPYKDPNEFGGKE